MCLSVPGKVLSVSGDGPLARHGRVDFGGTVREANLSFVPEAGVGDWVLVHVGVAITQIDEQEAGRVFEYLREAGELEEGA
ncbi:MAG: HypC/HybG/HupF family hydrogenase formation chaperone [Candidatus Brocadiae bacterium]|nr:HypC/HybG/HupF family hydrogenase formation chaperone [Candidatus Brocadiia bacterium]